MGATAGGVLFASCFSACKKSSDTGTKPLSFTLDLNDSANAALKTNGGYLVSNGVIVAKTLSGNYIAVAAACTHQGTTVQYDSSGNRFHCPNHGSNFTTTGAVINGPATTALQQYNTELTGSSLRVFS